MGPGRSYFGTAAIEGGVSEKLEKTMGFFSFFDQGIVSQTPFQIEDNQKSVFFQIEDIRGVLKNMFQIEDNISSGHPEGSTKLVFK